ncbi:MAG: dependent oxidoreductase family protein [Gammaproteobacteria bacterium]|nr:dependent oxidoreductase family protein [Gammaproteobacteria bacterium]
MDIQADVAIVGGGIMGSSLAYWLSRFEPRASVVVFVRDPTYAAASSALSAASIRQQFTSPVNIRISQASIELLRHADEFLAVEGWKPDIGLSEGGYLYLARQPELASLRQAQAIQMAHGADVALLDPAQLKSRFPWLDTTDIAAGSLGLSGEGWFDGYSLLTAFARKARSQGVQFIRGEVQELEVRGPRVETVGLADGSRIRCGHLVNAAGPWARSIAQLAGLELPVFARRRTVYVVACRTIMKPFPLLIDPSGFWIRPEGACFIAGIAPGEDPDEAPLEPEYEGFESVLWPALAARIPAFETAKLERAWAGYYEMNVFDRNGIVGCHPRIRNFAFMNGFSGHGMQQGPVVGRGLAELILYGRFDSVDLSELWYERIELQQPLLELNVIG